MRMAMMNRMRQHARRQESAFERMNAKTSDSVRYAVLPIAQHRNVVH
jgi:hypothetical protein